jgi:uncharacterized protein YjbJ (UPF0337 family)
MDGKKEQVKGKVDEVAGKLTGNIGMQVKGKAEQAIGNMQETEREIDLNLREKAAKAKAAI